MSPGSAGVPPARRHRRFRRWLLARLGERSTWIGLFALATAFGLELSPEQTDALAWLALLLFGGVNVVTPDARRD